MKKLLLLVLGAFISLTIACDYSSYQKNKDSKKEAPKNTSEEKLSESTSVEKEN